MNKRYTHGKYWYKSKTIRFGLLTILVGLIHSISEGSWQPLELCLIGLIQIALRYNTTASIRRAQRADDPGSTTTRTLPLFLPWFPLVVLLAFTISTVHAQETAPPVYPTTAGYESTQSIAGVGPGKTTLVRGYDATILKVTWSTGFDRTITFQATTPTSLTPASLTCTHLESALETSTATAEGPYLCPTRGKQNLSTPISGGTVGNASVLVVAKLPITVPIFQRTTIQEGPPGPQGIPGEPGVGEAGPEGPAGPAGASYKATSITPVTIGTGSQTWVTQAGRAYANGTRVRISKDGDSAKFMEGRVSSYDATTLVVNVDLASGSGQHTSWNISNAGEPGSSFGTLHSAEFAFTETAGAGVYTATLPMQAGSWLFGIWAYKSADWDADTAVLRIGDGVDDTRWVDDVDIVSTSPWNTAAPIVIDAGKANTARFFHEGEATPSDEHGSPFAPYATSDTLTMTLTTTGAGGTTGRLTLRILYMLVPTSTAATKE